MPERLCHSRHSCQVFAFGRCAVPVRKKNWYEICSKRPMVLCLRTVVVVVLTSFAACGGREGGATPIANDGGADDTAPSDGSAPRDATSALPDGSQIIPSGIGTKAGECQAPADCTLGNSGDPQCAEVFPGGYRVCVYQTPVAIKPSMNPAGDQCDGTRPCTSGTCYEVQQFPSGVCGLGGVSIQNLCRSDGCSSDADCSDGICSPRGLTSENNVSGGFVRQCFHADCRSNTDCTAHPQGVCALVAGGCPNTPGFRPFHPSQLACVYPDGCFSNADCGQGSCMVVAGSGVCVVNP